MNSASVDGRDRARRPQQARAEREPPRRRVERRVERPVERPVREEGALTAVATARIAIDDVRELTGKEPLGIVSVEQADDGWTVGVEAVEEHRIPSSADMLGLYTIQLDPDGELVSCHRDRRYLRGSTDTGRAG